jgi:uncharacterized protein
MLATDFLLVLAGFFAGAVGGVIGIGGGFVFVPALTLGFGVGQATAQGTSLAAIVPTSLVAAVTADREGNVLRSRVATMAVLGAVGAVGGALLALALPAGVLGRLFGAFLVVSAWRLWRAEPRRANQSPAEEAAGSRS